MSTFDAELRILRHQKFKLDIVMKNADLRLVGSLRLRSVLMHCAVLGKSRRAGSERADGPVNEHCMNSWRTGGERADGPVNEHCMNSWRTASRQ